MLNGKNKHDASAAAAVVVVAPNDVCVSSVCARASDLNIIMMTRRRAETIVVGHINYIYICISVVYYRRPLRGGDRPYYKPTAVSSAVAVFFLVARSRARHVRRTVVVVVVVALCVASCPLRPRRNIISRRPETRGVFLLFASCLRSRCHVREHE